MADDDDFNSSDIDVSDDIDHRSSIGTRAINSIIQRSAIERIESKNVVKKLRDIANIPSTQIHRDYWHELFKNFATHTLKIECRPKYSLIMSHVVLQLITNADSSVL